MATLPTDAVMTRRILATWRAATPAQRAEGEAWYPRAWAVCQDLAARHGVPARTVAELIAALSPLTHWERNLAYARLALTAGPHTVPTLGHARACAARVLAGGVAGGPKVRAFAAAIAGDEQAVVVDRHALAVVTGRPAGKTTLTPAQYRRVVAAYTRAARRVGVSPRVLQAVTWLVQRGRPPTHLIARPPHLRTAAPEGVDSE